jgi:thioredoxin 1
MAGSSYVKSFTDDNFQKETSKGVVLVDFNAVWCAPCRMLAPIVEQIAEHYKERIIVAKIDIDSEQKIAAQFQVTSVPTVILFKDGKEADRLVGLRDFDVLKEFVDAAL